MYDYVIIGSGLGGLISAVILAKEGKKVCVLEKNNQYGGNLQTFVREKVIFDTGVHYIGSLGKDEILLLEGIHCLNDKLTERIDKKNKY